MVVLGVMQKQASPAKKKRGRTRKTSKQHSENLFLRHGVMSGMRHRENENILGFDLPGEMAASNNAQANQNANFNQAHGASKQSRKNDVKLNIRFGGDLKILKTDEYQDVEEISRENSDSNQQSGCEDNYNDNVTFDKKLVAPEPDLPDEVFQGNNPVLIVPPSSTDLLLSNSLLLSAFEVYEALRRFHQQLRLTPFKIEDFCFVLLCHESTQLLSEIHISLLKLIIKGEETAGYSFTPSDSKTSFDFAVYSMDEGTWPAMILEYIMSLENCPDSVISVVAQPNYPFVSARCRLAVLQTLVNIFLELEVIRKELASEGQIIYDIKCSRCGDGGNLLCCDNCPCVYHLQCIKPPLEKIPENQWLCPLCECNQIPGANDACCQSADSIEEFESYFSVRNEMLGYDRHLRRYWFMARRLIIESYGHVRYYSQIDQVNFILESLDASSLESVLHAKLISILPEIQKQMALTAEMTETAWNEYRNGDKCESKLVLAEDIEAFENFIKEQSLCSRMKNDSVKEESILSEAGIKCNFMDLSSSQLSCSDNEDNQQFYLKTTETEDEFYSASINQDDNLLACNIKENLFCLGMEESSMSYVNFFTSLAATMLKSSQWRESDDKKRYLGYKFCLNPELRWSSSMVGSKETIAYSLKQTLKQLEDQIPATFLLDSWYEKFPRGVNSIVGYHPEPHQILVALRALEISMKPSIFLPVWRESCSQLGLWAKLLQSKKDIEAVSTTCSKDSLPSISINKSFQTSVPPEACQTLNECINDEYSQHLSDAGLSWPVFVSIPLKHNLYKFKGELYRQKGNGWVWKRRRRRNKEETNVRFSSNEKFYQLPKYRTDDFLFTSTFDNSHEQLSAETSFSNQLENLVSRQNKISMLSLLQRRLEAEPKEAPGQKLIDTTLCNIKSKLLLQISEIEAETTLIKSQLSKLTEKRDSLEVLQIELLDSSALICYAHKDTFHLEEPHLSCYSPLCRERLKLLFKVQKICGEASETALKEKVQNIKCQIHRNGNRVETLHLEIARLKEELVNVSHRINSSFSSRASGLYKLPYKKMPTAKTTQKPNNQSSNLDIFSLPSEGLQTLSQNADLEVSAPQVGMSSCYVQKNATSAHYWPYFCDRPTNKFSWRFRIRSALEQQNFICKENSQSKETNSGSVCLLSSTALCIKLLHACVRWDELRELKSLNAAQIPGVTFLNKGFAYRLELENGSAIIKEPQNIRDIPPDNVETEFLMRIVELPKDSGERAIVNNYLKNSSKKATGAISPSNRKGPRTRRSARTPKFKESFLSNTERSVEVKWIAETELPLWEVKYLLDRRDAIISKHEQDKLKKEREAKRKASSVLDTGLDGENKADIESFGNKVGVKEERDSDDTKDSTDSETSEATKTTVEVKSVFPATPTMKNKVVVLRVGDGNKQFILNSTPTVSGITREPGKIQPSSPSVTPARIRVIPASLLAQSLASNSNAPNCFRVISSPQKTNIVSTPGSYPQVMQLVATNNSEKKYILKTQLPVPNPDVKVVKPENESFSVNGHSEPRRNGFEDVIQLHNNAKPAYHKLNSVAETLPADLRPTPRESGSRRSCKTKTKSKLKPSQSSPKGGTSEVNESCINNYNALTKRLSNKCSEMAARAYKTQVLRKRDLMREQIDLELMFHDKKVPLTRQIYEMPYTAVIQHQLLPEDDNDPNISFPSCSSESDHDLTPQRSTTSGIGSKPKSSKKPATANLITVGKRSAMSKQMQEKNLKRRNRGEKRKISESKSESDFDGKTSDSDSKLVPRKLGSLNSGGNSLENKRMKPVDKKSRKVDTSLPTTQKGCQLKFGDRETLHCVCQTPYDYTKFYLKCDLCLKWFHGKCVGIDGRAAKKLSEFLCPSCTKNSYKDELYCICRTPYDDSQFYIGCDECGDWFHGSCVGIDSEEAQNIDTYFCPQCKSSGCVPEETNFSFGLEGEHFALLLELMTVLMAHTHSWPFVEQSTDAEYPGYSEVVKSPICFKDIVYKLKKRRYKYFSEFHSDMNRVFENARSFHRRESSELQCCDIVEKELVTFLISFRQSIAQDEDLENEN